MLHNSLESIEYSMLYRSEVDELVVKNSRARQSEHIDELSDVQISI